MSVQASSVSVANSKVPNEQQQLADIGFITSMTLTLLGNYAQTGHFGGPLAYTPFNVATHLAGPAAGGLRFDYRRPKHPYSDKFMLAAGHCAPTCYALWIIMGEALHRKYQATGDRCYYVAPDLAMYLSIDTQQRFGGTDLCFIARIGGAIAGAAGVAGASRYGTTV